MSVKISNTKFLDIILQTGISVNELDWYFSVILKLSTNYGLIIFSNDYLSIISQQNKTVSDLLILLKKIWYVNYKQIKQLHNIIVRHSDYKPSFVLELDDKRFEKDIETHLSDKFWKIDFIHKEYKWEWLKINWWDWYFKKDIDQDIDKILDLK